MCCLAMCFFIGEISRLLRSVSIEVGPGLPVKNSIVDLCFGVSKKKLLSESELQSSV
jgi:hypothetical protein